MNSPKRATQQVAGKTHRARVQFQHLCLAKPRNPMCVLSYRTALIGCFLLRRMPRTYLTLLTARIACRRNLFVLGSALLALLALPSKAQQVRLPSGKGQYAELSSDGPQTRKGDLFLADKNVDLLYAGMRLRADHLEYNDKTHDALARGNVQFDFENQHLEAGEANYNFATGAGTFTNVRGSVNILRRANPMVLVSENPLYFEAR